MASNAGRNTMRPLALAFVLLVSSSAAFAEGELSIHFIDVGQGDATLVECPNGNRILVDAGVVPYPSPHRLQRIREYVRWALDPDERALHRVVVTHPDSDHYSLLPAVLRGIRIDKLILADPVSAFSNYDYTEHRHNGRRWLERVESAGKVVQLPAEHHDPQDTPSPLFDCGEAKIWVLAAGVIEANVPEAHRPRYGSAVNTRSIVLLIQFGEFDAILTGDATFATEYRILQRYPNAWLDVEVLKIGHHGSSTTSTGPGWARATKPAMAVASAGYRNSHGHPRKSVLDTLAPYTENDSNHRMRWWTSQSQFKDEYGYTEAIYSTGSNGDIVVTSDGESWWMDY